MTMINTWLITAFIQIVEKQYIKTDPLRFSRDFIAYWRERKDILLKVLVILGLLLHVSFLISLKTGWWDPYFHAGMNKTTQAVDFFAIYVTGHELLNGRSIYPVEKSIVDGEETYVVIQYQPVDENMPEKRTPFRYLPTAAYVATALTLFKPWTAYILWVILYEILFFASILILGFHFKSMKGMHVAAALYLFFTPWYPEIFIGQHSFLQSVFILGMLCAILSGKPGRTAGWWITSVLWKINTAICLPAFIRWRKWGAVIWLFVILAVTCIPYFLYHREDIAKFIAMNFRPAECAYSGNFGFQGLLAKVLIKFGHDETSSARIIAIIATVAFFTLISLVTTILARRDRFGECICLWITTSFLIYQDVWEHHFVMLLPVVAYLYLKRPGRFLWFTWLLMALPTTHRFFCDNFQSIRDTGLPLYGPGATHFWNVWHYTLIKPMGLLMLFGYCVYVTIGRNVRKSD